LLKPLQSISSSQSEDSVKYHCWPMLIT
jgi:hypothetical protein